MFHLKRQNIPAVTGAFRHYFAQYSLVSFYKTYLDPRWPGSSSATVRCLCLNQVGQRKTNGCYVEWSQRNKRRDGVWFRQREDDSKEVRKTKMKNDVFEHCMVWTYVKYVNRVLFFMYSHQIKFKGNNHKDEYIYNIVELKKCYFLLCNKEIMTFVTASSEALIFKSK